MKRSIAYDSLVISISLLLIFICGCNTLLQAQTRIKPSIQTTKLAENFYKIYVHNFVNILVFNGPDGALLVDTGSEPVDLIEAELKKIGIDKIKFIINTHSHGDHVEGNALLGRKAVIISSHRCRDVLLEDDNFPKSGLPNLTFSDSICIHFNDEEINLYFMPGHSDNDIVVHFTKANIVCIGDFGFLKPYSVWPGFSANVYDMEKSMIRMTKLFSDEALIFRGHSDYTMDDLKLNTEMLKEAIMLVSPLIQQGLTLDQIKKRNPLKNSAFSIVRENSEKWIESIFSNKRHSNKK
ncbi:MAG: MBL fold metallo-hydrolase [Candidatus Aminicenantes bacterium]|jgi:glyoxylase-like metal-dependent hydrolase (beta-lactamase superfamily II)